MRFSYLIDGDGTTLDTGAAKLEYVRSTFRQSDIVMPGRTVDSISAHECTRGILDGILGEGAYMQMAMHVYSLQGTRGIEPIPGAIEGVVRLAANGDVCILSARPPPYIDHLRAWALHAGIPGTVQVRSSKDVMFRDVPEAYGSKKAGIAAVVGAQLLLDDDDRQLPQEEIAGLTCVLFGGKTKNGRELPPHLHVANSWAEIIRYAETPWSSLRQNDMIQMKANESPESRRLHHKKKK